MKLPEKSCNTIPCHDPKCKTHRSPAGCTEVKPCGKCEPQKKVFGEEYHKMRLAAYSVAKKSIEEFGTIEKAMDYHVTQSAIHLEIVSALSRIQINQEVK